MVGLVIHLGIAIRLETEAFMIGLMDKFPKIVALEEEERRMA
jgi:hypothetical protein